jgi:hypothetical protein
MLVIEPQVFDSSQMPSHSRMLPPNALEQTGPYDQESRFSRPPRPEIA